jgi:DNA-binding NarL/FixJ family response regulator
MATALIVDEASATRSFLKNLLKTSFSFRMVEAVPDIARAERACNELGHFEWLFVEQTLPDGAADEAIGRLAAHGLDLSRCHVVVLASTMDKNLVLGLAKLGVRDIVTKPLSAAKVAERIRRFVSPQRPA